MITFKQFLSENWAITGAKLGMVVSISRGGQFDSKQIYFLAKDGKWVEVGMPSREKGKLLSTITHNGEELTDKQMATLDPSLVREPSEKIDSVYDLEAMPVGSKISRKDEVYIKNKDGWSKEGENKSYSVVYMTGVLDSDVKKL